MRKRVTCICSKKQHPRCAFESRCLEFGYSRTNDEEAYAETTVPAEVCPQPVPSSMDFVYRLGITHREEFVSKYFFNKLDAHQRYNYVYEKVRSFYVQKLHTRLLSPPDLTAWNELTGLDRQKEGRRAFKELESEQKRVYTQLWSRLTQPPPYIASFVLEHLIQPQPTGGARVRSRGALLTWILPDTFVDVSAVVGKGEPTAPLRELTRLLRTSSELQTVWEDCKLHGRACMSAAGAADAAMCLEVCQEAWQLHGGHPVPRARFFEKQCRASSLEEHDIF